MYRAVLIALAVSAVAIPVAAQETAEEVAGTVDQAVDIRQDTQAREDDWAEERGELQVRYRSAQANVDYLQDQRNLKQAEVDALEERIAEFERRLTEATRLRDSIQDTLNTVLLRLEDWLDRDLPFLPEERAARLATLNEELARPDVTSADKLRRILEALQIEVNYGGTVEVTQEEIEIDGEPIFVDLLRVGRLSLFWTTPDGKRVGDYDAGARAWRELAGKYGRPIKTAMEMATRMRPTELIALPLGRIER